MNPFGIYFKIAFLPLVANSRIIPHTIHKYLEYPLVHFGWSINHPQWLQSMFGRYHLFHIQSTSSSDVLHYLTVSWNLGTSEWLQNSNAVSSVQKVKVCRQEVAEAGGVLSSIAFEIFEKKNPAEAILRKSATKHGGCASTDWLLLSIILFLIVFSFLTFFPENFNNK